MSVRERVRTYRQRVRRAGRQPLRITAAATHLLVMAGAVALTIVQVESVPIRTIVAVGLSVLVLFAVSTPGGGAGMTVILGVGLTYLGLTSFAEALTPDGAPITVPDTWEILLLAGALYLSHLLDALRSVLPYDAGGDPDVLLRWLRRGLEGLVPGLLLGALVILLPTASRGGTFWLVGGLALLAAVAIPVFAVDARPWRANSAERVPSALSEMRRR